MLGQIKMKNLFKEYKRFQCVFIKKSKLNVLNSIKETKTKSEDPSTERAECFDKKKAER